MSFLECAPSVFVIGEEYEILVNAKENGILYLEIGGEAFFEENAGVLATERAYAKIRVPQTVLDKAEAYTVVYSKTICHQAYFSRWASRKEKAFPSARSKRRTAFASSIFRTCIASLRLRNKQRWALRKKPIFI